MRTSAEDSKVTELLRQYDRQVAALAETERELKALGLDMSKLDRPVLMVRHPSGRDHG